ncbi:hypothetical protein Tcan_00873, partial [Toxocara canis]
MFFGHLYCFVWPATQPFSCSSKITVFKMTGREFIGDCNAVVGLGIGCSCMALIRSEMAYITKCKPEQKSTFTSNANYELCGQSSSMVRKLFTVDNDKHLIAFACVG